ncbi:hypothetical protein EYF80_033508 [Liparis tanakae]|uniref:Uncharacterized protein n=1 Tax=Liparis tanakae TaxID=230148 RepID=A0A4Z2GUA9_9TELE|nr:hypothetical protein EYF80_033508 [Liparis tanakae]
MGSRIWNDMIFFSSGAKALLRPAPTCRSEIYPIHSSLSAKNACFSISFLNSPCLLPSNSVCWPHSAMRRWSSTATALAFWMVDSR